MNLETTTAIYAGNVSIGYGVLIAVTSMISSWLITFSLVTAPGKRSQDKAGSVRKIVALLLYLPLFAIWGGAFGRLVHWYSHYETYNGIWNAFRSFTGSYHEAGMVLGFFISAFFSSMVCMQEDRKDFISAAAVGQMLFLSLVSLVSLFNSADRGKAVITDPSYQRLPISVPTLVASGDTEYRTAVFFWKFMVLLFIAVLSLIFHFTKKSVLYTYVCYFSSMALLDSARYDASFLRSNGFVSLMQVVAGVFLIVSIIAAVRHSVIKNRFRVWHVISVIVFLAGLGLTIYMEYYVQRHGNLYVFCYLVMAGACLIMALSVILTYGSGEERKRRIRRVKSE